MSTVAYLLADMAYALYRNMTTLVTSQKVLLDPRTAGLLKEAANWCVTGPETPTLSSLHT